MNEILHANIFFFVTGIAVIVFTFLLCIALYHLIKVLTTARRILDRVEAGTESITEDFERLRTYMVEQSFLSRFFRAARRQTEEGEPKSRKGLPKNDKKSKTELRIKNQE